MRAGDAEAVARALGLRTVLPANWSSGLAPPGGGGVFVAPPVDGWVLVVGPDVAAATRAAAAVVPGLLEALSRSFGRAAWFCVRPDEDAYGWAFADRGALQRGYAFAGDEGDVFWHGEVTEAERALACFLPDPRDLSDDEIKWWPDDRIALAIAAAWTVDPTRLGERALPPSCGLAGRL